MKFRSLHDRVVIRRVEGERITKVVIIIPDTVKEKPQEGEVVAVVPGARDEDGRPIPPEVNADDRVLFGKWSGSEVQIDGEDLLIMKESDILGGIERTTAARFTTTTSAVGGKRTLHLVEAGYAIPTILVTAYPDDADHDRAMNDEVVCYLRKPFDERHLFQCLRAALQLG